MGVIVVASFGLHLVATCLKSAGKDSDCSCGCLFIQKPEAETFEITNTNNNGKSLLLHGREYNFEDNSAYVTLYFTDVQYINNSFNIIKA